MRWCITAHPGTNTVDRLLRQVKITCLRVDAIRNNIIECISLSARSVHDVLTTITLPGPHKMQNSLYLMLCRQTGGPWAHSCPHIRPWLERWLFHLSRTTWYITKCTVHDKTSTTLGHSSRQYGCRRFTKGNTCRIVAVSVILDAFLVHCIITEPKSKTM